MISIIVPIYNVEKYLENCVNSIRCQSYSDIEVILVDDGSLDYSGKICDNLAKNDQRIRVIHQENKGLAAARNSGLSIAHGDYVAFVDSDDTIERDMYLMLHNIIEENHADIAICGCRKINNYESLKRVEYSKCKSNVLDKNKLWDLVFGQLNNSACNKLYKRELIGDLKFPEKMVHGEDLIFNIKYLIKCNTGVYNQAPMYNYFSRNDSITKSTFNENNFWEIVAKDKAKELIKEYMPIQLQNAEIFCFRARMNVLRSIFAADRDLIYESKINEMKKNIYQQYKVVKGKLRKKEKIEYRLLFVFPSLYRRMAKYYG